MKANTYYLTILLMTLLGVSCQTGPKESETFPYQAPLAQISLEGLSNDLHKVVVKDVYPTNKYLYLKVLEGNKEFWISVRKQPVSPGETYYYKESLLKTNFKGKERQEVFDTLYLVTKLIREDMVEAIHGIQ